LGERQSVLRDPKRQRSGFQCGCPICALSDTAKAGRQRDGKNGQRDQYLDERESFGWVG